MIPTPIGQYKLVLVGDSAVGKSSLLNQFIDGKFDEKLFSTIGVDFKFRRIQIGKQEIKLQIWDTAGQQTFRSIVSAYYNSADGIIICYDTTSYNSFESIQQYWLPQAQKHNKKNAKIFIVGTKIDLKQNKEVESFSLESLKQNANIEKMYQVSSKQNMNIEATFQDISKILYANNSTVKPQHKSIKSLTRTLTNEQDQVVVQKNKKPCCIG